MTYTFATFLKKISYQFITKYANTIAYYSGYNPPINLKFIKVASA